MNIRFFILVITTSLLASTAFADGHRVPSPAGAKVYFIAPTNGSIVSSPVTVKFGLVGMGVAPAGTEKKKTGHHHLLIDTKLKSYDESVPADAENMHYGGGQTEAVIKLAPGTHTLQLVLGDHNHIPHMPPVQTEVITIKVQ